MALGRDDLLSWLVSEAGIDASELTEETTLFSSGLIDSFVMVDLVAFVEERAGIAFGPLDINLANLDTVACLLAFIRSKS